MPSPHESIIPCGAGRCILSVAAVHRCIMYHGRGEQRACRREHANREHAAESREPAECRYIRDTSLSLILIHLRGRRQVSSESAVAESAESCMLLLRPYCAGPGVVYVCMCICLSPLPLAESICCRRRFVAKSVFPVTTTIDTWLIHF